MQRTSRASHQLVVSLVQRTTAAYRDCACPSWPSSLKTLVNCTLGFSTHALESELSLRTSVFEPFSFVFRWLTFSPYLLTKLLFSHYFVLSLLTSAFQTTFLSSRTRIMAIKITRLVVLYFSCEMICKAKPELLEMEFKGILHSSGNCWEMKF